jgi:ABC-type branched-subunit amino acid transport system permease subunit
VKQVFTPAALLRAAPLVMALVLLAVVPFVFGRYGTDLAVKVMIYAIFVAGLDLLVGRTGLVSLGHAAFFGIAAYVAVLASPADAPGALVVLLPLAVLAAAGFALVTGAPYARRACTSSWSRWPLRRWPITCSTTRPWVVAPTAST